MSKRSSTPKTKRTRTKQPPPRLPNPIDDLENQVRLVARLVLEAGRADLALTVQSE